MHNASNSITAGACIDAAISAVVSCFDIVCSVDNSVLTTGNMDLAYTSLGFSFFIDSERLCSLFKKTLIEDVLSAKVPKSSEMPEKMPERVKALFMATEEKLLRSGNIKDNGSTTQIAGYWQTKDRVCYLVVWINTDPRYEAIAAAVPVTVDQTA